MMIRLLTTSAGVLAAGATAALEVGAAAPPPVAFAWSAIAGVAGAGMTYGILTSKVNAAHARITAEKADRERAVSELKADVNRGFDEIKVDLREQTRTVLDALTRHQGDRRHVDRGD